MVKDHQISVRVNQKEWEDFKKVAENIGIPASRMISLFIKRINENQDTSFLLDYQDQEGK